MGVLQRFKDIMSANINSMLDKAENPEKMIDQYLRDLQEDLRKVKSETATVIAEETRCKRELSECETEIAKMENYAEKALLAGNESDAVHFLEKKKQLTTKHETLQQTYDIASANATKMKQMHDKLSRDIAELNSRKEAIKAKVQVAKTQEKMNKMMNQESDTSGSISAFERMEAKADAMLDKANAMSELNNVSNETENLMNKYDTKTVDVSDDLIALKEKLGIS